MKCFSNINIIKKFIIISIIMLLFNFSAPMFLKMQSVSIATEEIVIEETEEKTDSSNNSTNEDDDIGGKLFKPIGQLLCTIGDVVIIFMQDIFLGNNQIQYTIEDGITTFFIQYSPGAIFSNKIPALDINFFEPMSDYEVTIPAQWNEIKKGQGMLTGGSKNIEQDIITKIEEKIGNSYGFSKEIAENSTYAKSDGDIIGLWYNDEIEYKRYTWEKDGKEYLLAITVKDNEVIKVIKNMSDILDGNAANKAIGDILDAIRNRHRYSRNIRWIFTCY